MTNKLRTQITILLILITGKILSITPDQLIKLDLNKNYKSYKVNELRLIRSMIYARYGFLFTESELRRYFMTNFKWYDSLIYKNVELENQGKTIPPIVLTDQEQNFVNKIDKLIAEKCKNNFHSKDTLIQPNLENIANSFEEKDFPEKFQKDLEENGFAIRKGKYEQLFHVYDQNQYDNTPNFITTDLFLQLFHTYFAFTLKSIEKEKLIPLVTDLVESLYHESITYLNNKNKQVIKMAEFNACFFAVAYTLITDKKPDLPQSLVGYYLNELKKINDGKDYISIFFNKAIMPYSLFVPRGYYTRTEEQKRYFKTMMWLQIAPYCLSDNELLQNACFNAFLLRKGKSLMIKPLKDIYNAIYEPIAFLIGDADNLSINDICNVYEKYNVNNVEWLTDKKIIDMVASSLRMTIKEKDRIQPKIKTECHHKINFMPQRYLIDNDILQQFVDTTVNADKAFPKGLELFTVMGVNCARELLYKYYRENYKWKDYDSIMRQQIEQFKEFTDWDKTVYNKWLESLIKLNKVDKSYPYFMHNKAWKLKNLNTSLASWAELKHDVILYGEQPMAAEMGDGEELPPPVTVGYVEPNIEFWNACKELMAKNNQFLTKYNLKTEELENKTSSIKSLIDFFISVSQKEINNQPLTVEEYNTIEQIGGQFDYLSLSLLTPYVYYNSWEEVKGPDKTIAVIADIYTRNIQGCAKNGILHTGTGFGNEIHVIIEINGLLYLTRGATFSYYEFPYKERLTDENWIELLNNNEVAPVDWMNDMTLE
jgi:hypothetical protein